jgi:REP element-mobilizing transposase RayT
LLYHVIARGNQRQPTFLTDLDYQAYLIRLATYQKRYGVMLYAYCLMPNHVHLLLQTPDPPLAKFMQGLQQSYTQRFNRVHGKVGHLFQGRYKAIVCETDEYLATLIRYIHLNPVRARLVEDPEVYPYSGHRAYLTGDGTALIDPGPVLSLLGGRAAYRRFVLAGIGAGHEERYYQTEDQQFLGAQGFAQRIRQQAAQPAGSLPRKPLDMALRELARQFPLDPSTLQSPDRSQSVTTARAVLSFVLVRRLGYRVADVAAALGRDVATISVTVSRLASRLESSDRLAADVARLSRNV